MRSTFIRSMMSSGVSDSEMAIRLAEFDVDQAKLEVATAKAVLAARNWKLEKLAAENTCDCGVLIAPKSTCCRACIDNGAALKLEAARVDAIRHRRVCLRVIPRRRVDMLDVAWSGGLVSPR